MAFEMEVANYLRNSGLNLDELDSLTDRGPAIRWIYAKMAEAADSNNFNEYSLGVRAMVALAETFPEDNLVTRNLRKCIEAGFDRFWLRSNSNEENIRIGLILVGILKDYALKHILTKPATSNELTFQELFSSKLGYISLRFLQQGDPRQEILENDYREFLEEVEKRRAC